MRTPKTLPVIECRMCNGIYFAGDTKVTINPANENDGGDEINIVVKKVARCTSCAQKEDRTLGGRKIRFER